MAVSAAVVLPLLLIIKISIPLAGLLPFSSTAQ